MKTNHNHLLRAALIAAAALLTSHNAVALEYVDERVFIEDFSIAPGQTVPLTLWIDNTCTWSILMADMYLPAGLELEKINPDELDTEHFTIHYPATSGTSDYVALSTEFTDQSYQDEDYLNELEYQKRWYGEDLETFAYVELLQDDKTVIATIFTDYYDQHYGLYRLVQYWVRATEELAPESVIITRVGFIGNKSKYYEGPEVNNQFDGTPTECRVRRVDPPTAVADIAAAPERGDGVYYNLLGQPVPDPAPGIYVRNGKKVLVK